MIPLQLQVFVSTNSLSLLSDRNFYFEPTQQPKLFLFAHLMTHNTKDVLVQNKSNLPVQVPQKLKLGVVIEVPFDNCFNAAIKIKLTAVLPSNLSEPQQLTTTTS